MEFLYRFVELLEFTYYIFIDEVCGYVIGDLRVSTLVAVV